MAALGATKSNECDQNLWEGSGEGRMPSRETPPFPRNLVTLKSNGRTSIRRKSCCCLAYRIGCLARRSAVKAQYAASLTSPESHAMLARVANGILALSQTRNSS